MTYYIHSLEDIPSVASKLKKNVKKHKIVALYGEMGIGKTTLIKELCKQLGCVDVATSPTFALVNEYFTSKGDSVYHFDFYRIKTPVELYDIGYEDYVTGKSICFIEWPEMAEDLIPEDALKIKITLEEDGSRKVITA
ncbi:MAG: tRNA (adenosine(37)-N6)-threonylcarbamoyltransferase complex ATPase subunit type 1 TsaE [Bacteroidetes bacterium]|jgi:tRNA threonylcarbamoyladenosine biosynthesis protein TsaE|nr:tRNA (adenosine(37)-N6)-threonylcarbamoyltransferase complex ATPase subunit type 1 TsaE [Bacteroidota bacterium]